MVWAQGHYSGDEHVDRLEKNISKLQYDIIQPELFNTPGGSRVYYVADHELPLVRLELMIHRGKFHDPQGKEGLAEFFARFWRLAGGEHFSGDELNRFFEFHGGHLEVGFGRQYGHVALLVHKKKLKESLKRFRDLLLQPNWQAQDKMSFVRSLQREKLRRNLQKPIFVAARVFREHAFAGAPYAREKTLTSLQKIKLKDLKQFYKQTFTPKNVSWVITGDITQKEVKSFLSNISFTKNNNNNKNKNKFEDRREDEGFTKGVYRRWRGKVILVDRPLPQSTIVMGRPAMPFSHKKMYAMRLANFIVGGGGFNSLLTQEVRSNRGLAYSVGSVYRPYRDFGVFLAYAQTKNFSVAQVIRLMQKQFERISTKGVPRQGVNRGKQSMVNKFVFSFSNSHDIARRRFHFDWNKLPESYLNEYTDNIRSVSAKDVDSLAAELLSPQEMVTVVVGPADKLKEPLSRHFDLRVFKP